MCGTHKALIITPFYGGVGGAETFVESLKDSLIKSNYQVDIATIGYSKLWEGMNYLKSILLAKRLIPIVLRHTRHKQYDKIFALGLISSAVARILRLRYSSIILALYEFDKPNLMVKWALSKADKVFVEGLRGETDMWKAGIPLYKMVRFQHWVNDKFVPIDREINHILKVLFVGRSITIKGKHIIEQVEKILMERVNFIYVENVPYQDLPKYYQMADICVVPSLYSEGFSRVVAEAMSCGCIVVASNRGSLPEQIKRGGLCIDPTVDNYVRVLESFLYERQYLVEWRNRSIEYAKENFSIKNSKVFTKEAL